MMPLLFLALFFLWLAFLGGTVGSFLNVVVYRVPAGMSVVHPPSRCPRCEHAIRWYDNIPVLGWLWLRGRCRDCGEPISVRYPVVEAITAAMFVAVAWADGLHAVWMDSFVTVRGAFVGETFYYVCGLYLLHVVLIGTLWSAALMQYDGHIPPARLVVVSGAILGIATVVFYQFFPRGTLPGINIVSGLMMAGYAMISTYFWTAREAERTRGRWTFVELVGICGMVIMPGSLLLVIAWAVLFGLLVALTRPRSDYPLLCLLAGLMIYLTLGPFYEWPISKLMAILPHGHSWIVNGFAVGLAVVLMTEACALIRWRMRKCQLTD